MKKYNQNGVGVQRGRGIKSKQNKNSRDEKRKTQRVWEGERGGRDR